jgi:ABC-type phosphonate transport system ATPase subunit
MGWKEPEPAQFGHTGVDARSDTRSLRVLPRAAGKQVKTYSGGMRRRLDLAASLIAAADLYFLDEPTTGLDRPAAASTGTLRIRLADPAHRPRAMQLLTPGHRPHTR